MSTAAAWPCRSVPRLSRKDTGNSKGNIGTRQPAVLLRARLSPSIEKQPPRLRAGKERNKSGAPIIPRHIDKLGNVWKLAPGSWAEPLGLPCAMSRSGAADDLLV